MRLQIGLQRRVVRYELLILDQGRVLAKLPCSFAMVIEKLIEAGQFAAGGIAVARGAAVAGVFAPIVTVFRAHERVRIFGDFLAHTLMLLQIGLQVRILAEEFLIVHKRWIFAKLFGSFAMVIEKLIEARQLAAGGVPVARHVVTIALNVAIAIAHGIAVRLKIIAVAIVVAGVFTPIITVFLMHETVWVFSDLLAHSRMILQVSLQVWILAEEFLIVHQRRVLAKLFGGFAMAV